MTISLPDQLHSLICSTLTDHKTSQENAVHVADALLAAEIDGQKGHGISRLVSYAKQAQSGKVDGFAQPKITAETAAMARIDAANGFAYPALSIAAETLIEKTKNCGLAAVAVYRSHHFGQAGYHVEKLADAGLVGLVFGNSPQAIAPWGGTKPVFGTNPIAFAAPQRSKPPLVIDMSLSKVARGKVMVAAQKQEPIPEGWALNEKGHPTTDADEALAGTMLPMGDAKGAALVLMVEILAAALTGANFSYEAGSFFTADGSQPGVGQILMAFDPKLFSNDTFLERFTQLANVIEDQDGARLPGESRLKSRESVRKNGLAVDPKTIDAIKALTPAK